MPIDSPTTTPITIASLRRIAFERYRGNGVLTVFPTGSTAVPFPILRVFTIVGVSRGGRRANHAHRGCTQLLACLTGRVEVAVNDGRSVAVEALEADGTSLLIPPMLWNSVTFEGPATVLAVFCDQIYHESDYIRDWDEYYRLNWPNGCEDAPEVNEAIGTGCNRASGGRV